ncbi:MAG: hypothetical protein ICV67_03015 [Thermoleophilia bacterium]|nr:hypothetical protein [Thermoleophilia bacterium]
MRTVASVLAVGAVVAVALAAALDVLRPGPERLPTDLAGELVYSEEDCSRHALRLPSLVRRDFLTVGCGVFTRRDNLGVQDGVVAWFAYPAPGGTTTLLRNADVREVAWLGGRRFAASLAGGRLTVWEGDSLLGVAATGPYRGLRASPSRRWFAAAAGDELAVFDRAGRRLWTRPGHAVAWSPDERYAAVAGVREVAIVPAAGGEPVAKIPLSAADVDWRQG